MSQDWVSNLYTTATVVDTTMSNVELMFATLKSSFAGSSTPSNAAAGQVWYDSNASYKCLQVRDSANAAWRGVMVGSSSCKVWLYLNAVEEGWTIDSSVTDKVLSLKGGSTYVTGADDSQGTWTISGLTDSGHTHSHSHSHFHQIYNYTNINDIKVYNAAGAEIGVSSTSGAQQGIVGTVSANGELINHDMYSKADATVDATSGTASTTSDGTWRVAAATGILAAPTARG